MKLLAVVLLSFGTLVARADLSIQFTSADAEIVSMAEDVGESDVALFAIKFDLSADGGDVYIPSDALQSIVWDFHWADPYIVNEAYALDSSADEMNNYFMIQDGHEERFTFILEAQATQDVFAWLEITDINWTDTVDGNLTPHSNFDQELETDTVFINTTIVPEPSSLMLILGGGTLVVAALRRKHAS